MFTRRAIAAALALPLAILGCASDTGKPAEPAKPAAPTAAKPAPPPTPKPATGDEDRPMRMANRVRFGAQPDYSYDGPGVKIEQVSAGASAEAAGIKPGDILKTWNGQKIDDIYKWMEFLSAAKPGDVADVGVQRDGKTVPIKVTLKAAE